MNRTRAVAAEARRRLLISRVVSFLGPALLIGAAGAGLIVTLDRLTALTIAPFVAIALPLGLAVIIAILLALRRPASLISAASRLDSALALRDRISTALATEPRSDPFARLAVDAGESAAASASVRRAIPIRFGRIWVFWPVLALAALAAAIWAPEWSPQSRRAQRLAQVEAAERRELVNRLDQAIAVARQSPLTAAASDQSLRELEELRRELDDPVAARPDEPAGSGAASSPPATNDPATRAALALDQLSREQEQAAVADRATAESIQESLARIPQHSAAPETESELTRALRRGDIERAARQAADHAEQLQRAAEQLTPAEREQLAQDLRRLANDLAKAQKEAPDATIPPAPTDSQPPAEAPPPGTTRVPESAPGSIQEAPDQSEPSRSPDRSPAEQLTEQLRRAADDLAPPAGATAPPETPPSPRDAASPAQPSQPPPAEPASSDRSPNRTEDSSQPGSAPERRSPGEPGEPPSTGRPADRSAPANPAQPAGKSSQPNQPQAQPQPQSQPGREQSSARETEQPGRSPASPDRQTSPGESASPAQRREGPSSAPGERQNGQQSRPDRSGQPANPRETPAAPPDATPQSGESPTQPRATEAGQAKSNQSQKNQSRPDQSQPGPSQSQHSPSAQQPKGDTPAPSGEAGATPQPRQHAAQSTDRRPDGQTPPGDRSKATKPRDAQAPGQGLRDLRDQLQRLADAPQRANQREQLARDLRREAGRMTPASDAAQPPRARGQLPGHGDPDSQVAGIRSANPGNHPPASPQPTDSAPRKHFDRVEPVDARAPGTSDRTAGDQVVAEWLGRGAESADPARFAEIADRLRQATRSAEQAIGDRAVPSRFDRVLREYFRRLPAEVSPRPATEPPPASP